MGKQVKQFWYRYGLISIDTCKTVTPSISEAFEKSNVKLHNYNYATFHCHNTNGIAKRQNGMEKGILFKVYRSGATYMCLVGQVPPICAL